MQFQSVGPSFLVWTILNAISSQLLALYSSTLLPFYLGHQCSWALSACRGQCYKRSTIDNSDSKVVISATFQTVVIFNRRMFITLAALDHQFCLLTSTEN